MPSERAWWSSVSMISRSQNSSSCARPSTTVTCTPSVANMMAYSRPITPPPTTIIDRGTRRQAKNFVGVENRFAVERDVVGPRRAACRGPAGCARPSRICGSPRPVTSMRCGSTNDASPQTTLTRLRANWSWRTCHSVWPTLRIMQPQVVHRDFAFAAVAVFVDVAVAIAGEVQDRFANGLRGDRAGVERDAAQQLALPFDDGDAPVLFGGGNGCFLSGWSAAHHDQVVSHVRMLDIRSLVKRRTPPAKRGLRRGSA